MPRRALRGSGARVGHPARARPRRRQRLGRSWRSPTGLGEVRNALVVRAASRRRGRGRLRHAVEIALALKTGGRWSAWGRGSRRSAVPERTDRGLCRAQEAVAQALRTSSRSRGSNSSRSARCSVTARRSVAPCPTFHARQLAACAVALVAVSLLGALAARARRRRRGWAAAGAAAPAIRGGQRRRRRRRSVIVHVAGAVRGPASTGCGRARGSTTRSAARAARRAAPTSAVNLAAKVEDGRQVLVPGSGGRAAARARGARRGDARRASPINLNTATLEQLDTLDGVGPATAQKILDYREEHGGFGSVDELGAGARDRRRAARLAARAGAGVRCGRARAAVDRHPRHVLLFALAAGLLTGPLSPRW